MLQFVLNRNKTLLLEVHQSILELPHELQHQTDGLTMLSLPHQLLRMLFQLLDQFKHNWPVLGGGVGKVLEEFLDADGKSMDGAV